MSKAKNSALTAVAVSACILLIYAVCSTASFACDSCGKKKQGAQDLVSGTTLLSDNSSASNKKASAKSASAEKTAPADKIGPSDKGQFSDPSMDFILKLDSRKMGIKSQELPAGSSPSVKGSARSDTLNGGTNSTTLTGGAGSTTLQAGTGSTLLRTGSDTTMLQVGTKSTSLNIGTASTLIQGNVEHESLPVNVLILLDTSMTMKQGMDGIFPSKQEVKIDVAKRVLRETSAAIPPHVKVGLRVFGGGVSHNDDVDCHQSALLVPIETNNHNTLVNIANGLQPAGLTPLAYALQQAPDDFQDLHGIRRVVLITDGMDTCKGDPCAEIKRLSQMGYKMKVDIVGMGVKHDQAARALFDCIAKNSGGKYYDADTAAELAKGLKESLADAVGEGTVSAQVLPKAKSPAP